MARVLVVDDAAFMRKVVSDALAAGGHEVVGEGSNGVEAVARFQELRPELTMLDITMPEKTGLEALAEIIAIDPNAKVLMCSALGAGVQGDRGAEAGRQELPGQAVQARPAVGGRGQGPRVSG
jgi:two-component system chemotaxis response regulator CheY